MTTVTAEPAAPLPPKLITQESVQENYAGLAWTDWLITLPAHIGFADLGEPSIWAIVQGGGKPLQVPDRLCIVDQDLSFLVEARVAAAGPTGVSLAILKRVEMPERTERLPSTEKWRIAFAGRGYRIVNKATGQPYPGDITYTSLSTAVGVLYGLEPRVVKSAQHRMTPDKKS